ncbi:flavin monoamine oxidase family protein [Mucilaginibacter gotjawali]|uniref:Tryptophan 2-monooxygenase n=2 Tax=Mucilaginibacter gotjawali TaxID=1550579 RepID=A0A0X8X095_9SPHI|nr:NAD(P)/FAD-dependent oxidoreductase [Mucilaginibacter gotjawali]MBB3056192.1 monoamine oxidase [Mucilaginibacter gotjawali]BAU53466.1 Putrescine oxidase [Mucilaginibacter gotjawali]
MNKVDVLIAGAGATGLMAACKLTKAGRKVLLLEARDRCGGRIHTINPGGFLKDTELGAEFIHGDLPVTLSLLKEAGIAYHPAYGEMVHYKNGKFDNDGGFEGWDMLMQKLQTIDEDISINQFLDKEFAGDEFNELKLSVRQFAAGYDSADPDKASTFALRNEWLNDDEEAQYRVNGGYVKMVDYLEGKIRNAGGNIVLNSIVKEVYWEPGNVKATTDNGTVYEAGQLIIALPLGVLQADKDQFGAITFNPSIPVQMDVINHMGFGAIIKILLEFDEPFWTDKQTEALAGRSLENMSFLLSDEEIPTWWTQTPQQSPVITGWLGGPPAAAKKDVPDREILRQSLQSLSNIFKRNIEELKAKLVASRIVNWTHDPFTMGSYAYDTVNAAAFREILKQPVGNTLFFAGEYLYDGAAMGTVEAALTSGEEVAKKMIT